MISDDSDAVCGVKLVEPARVLEIPVNDDQPFEATREAIVRTLDRFVQVGGARLKDLHTEAAREVRYATGLAQHDDVLGQATAYDPCRQISGQLAHADDVAETKPVLGQVEAF